MSIEEVKLDNDKMQIIVKSLKDKSEGLKFINGLVSASVMKELSADEYQHFIISQNNYEKLQKLPLPEKYIKFYNEYF